MHSFPLAAMFFWLPEKNSFLKTQLITSSCKPFLKPPPWCYLSLACNATVALTALGYDDVCISVMSLDHIAELLEDRGGILGILKSLVPIQHFIMMIRMNKTHIC